MIRIKLIQTLFQPLVVKTDDGNVYLRRYHLLRTRWIQIYVHNLCSSDLDTDLHDHPWSFVSIILAGGYTEYTPEGVFQRRARQILFLPVGSPHRLELSRPAWTLVITGKVQREWGFVTPSGWQSWQEHALAKEALKEKV